MEDLRVRGKTAASQINTAIPPTVPARLPTHPPYWVLCAYRCSNIFDSTSYSNMGLNLSIFTSVGGEIVDSVSCSEFSSGGGGADSDLGFRYDSYALVV